jgi:fused signal recognition particle receptor
MTNSSDANDAARQGWLHKLKAGLSRSSQNISEGITGIFTRRKLDAESLEELEELLIQSDMGVETAQELIEKLSDKRFEKDTSPEEVRSFLAGEITELLAPVAIPVEIDEEKKPFVILVCGVNGNGKTTTIGKMANQLQQGGWKVMMAAADTFRAAAVEQLQVWGERNRCPVITGNHEADPASVAYTALEQAKANQTDILLIDTAGRLHNKSNLMVELQKIIKVLKKLDPSAPHATLLVLDATTGQNALKQVEVFREMVNISGMVVTKLDGTAKGGIVLALARKYRLPIFGIGVGEGIDDLQAFEAKDFASHLVGLHHY